MSKINVKLNIHDISFTTAAHFPASSSIAIASIVTICKHRNVTYNQGLIDPKGEEGM